MDLGEERELSHRMRGGGGGGGLNVNGRLRNPPSSVRFTMCAESDPLLRPTSCTSAYGATAENLRRRAGKPHWTGFGAQPQACPQVS